MKKKICFIIFLAVILIMSINVKVNASYDDSYDYYDRETGELKPYKENKYPKYDNYNAINIDKVSNIPLDYEGVMGVPITFLDKYNPNQFEIVSFRKGEDGKDLVFTRERERVQPYFRILVRHRFQG